MPRIAGYRCTICGREFPFGPELMTCPDCGEKGILDILYDYDEVGRALTREVARRVPGQQHVALPGAAAGGGRRGRFPLPAHRLVAAVPLALARGGSWGSGRCTSRTDGINPTASLKDRASGVAVAKAIELGYDTIACSSTGNAASSCAGSAARAGLKAVIFVPERAPEGKVAQLMIFGATVVSVHGDYRATFELSRAAIDKYGWYNRNAGINPVMAEGKKTVALEIAEQLGWQVTDWVACSVGDGWHHRRRVQRVLRPVPPGADRAHPEDPGRAVHRLLPVRGRGAGEPAAAGPCRRTRWRIPSPWGVPRNPVKALRAVRESHGAWIAVPDESILAAMRTLGRHEGVFGEPAGVTATAGRDRGRVGGADPLRRERDGHQHRQRLKDVHNALRAAGRPRLCEPSLEALERSGHPRLRPGRRRRGTKRTKVRCHKKHEKRAARGGQAVTVPGRGGSPAAAGSAAGV